MQYTIPAENLGTLEAKLAKVNKAAAKVGATPATLTVISEHTKRDQDNPFIVSRWLVVDVQGEAPSFAGWTFVAALHHTEAGNVVKGIGEGEVPEQYRTARPRTCDHCGKVRNRKDTYVLRHDDGRYVQVGSACIKDFLGHADPQALAAFAEMMITLSNAGDFDEMFGRGGSFSIYTNEVLRMSAATIRAYGFISRTASREAAQADEFKQATADLINRYLSPSYKADSRDLYPRPIVTDEDTLLAETTFAWSQAADTKNEYAWNLKVALAKEYLDGRDLGLVVSAVSSYLRTQEKAAEKQAYEARPKAQGFIGTIGKRETFTLTIVWTKAISSAYGVSTLHKFVDGEGRVASWFASNGAIGNVGDTVTVKASIKKHETYKGEEQTVLTHATLV